MSPADQLAALTAHVAANPSTHPFDGALRDATIGEQWRWIPGWENRYEVSDTGRVRSHAYTRDWRLPTPRILAQTRTRDGHCRVRLARDGRSRLYSVHRLVLEAFVGPAPEGHQGCHGDGDPTNNSVENLRWDTQSANALDSVIRHRTHFQASKTECPHGHPYTPRNTGIRPDGSRICRTCARERTRERARLSREGAA